MTNKDNDNGLASEVSDAFGSAGQPALGGTFKIFPPSYQHFVPEMPGDSGFSLMERLYMEELDRLENEPTPEQVDELFEALGRSFK